MLTLATPRFLGYVYRHVALPGTFAKASNLGGAERSFDPNCDPVRYKRFRAMCTGLPSMLGLLSIWHRD